MAFFLAYLYVCPACFWIKHELGRTKQEQKQKPEQDKGEGLELFKERHGTKMFSDVRVHQRIGWPRTYTRSDFAKDEKLIRESVARKRRLRAQEAAPFVELQRKLAEMGKRETSTGSG